MQQYYGDNPHIIRKNRRRKRENSEKPPQRKGGRRFSAFVAVVILLALIGAVGHTVAKAYDGDGSAVVAESTWYFVSLHTETAAPEAELKAHVVATSGGAGYIHNAEAFAVVAAAYPTHAEATAVANKQTSAAVIAVKLKRIDLAHKLTDEQKAPFNAYKTAYRTLVPTLNKFDKGSATEAEMTYAVNQAVLALTKQKTALADYIAADGSPLTAKTLAALNTHLSECVSALNAALTDEDYSISASVRYALCEILISRRNLSENLQ